MKTPLDDKQKAAVDKLRESGKSIKAIAKEIHVSDRRVSAYLNERKCECSCKGKVSSPKKVKDKLVEMETLTRNNFEKSVANCTKIIYDSVVCGILEGIEGFRTDKHISKKNQQKKIHKRLDSLFFGLSTAMYEAAVAMMFSMPSKLKKLWVDSINRDPWEECEKGKK